jgi:hypothetical protein
MKHVSMNIRIGKWCVLVFAIVVLLPLSGYAGGGTITIQKTAPFEKDLAVPAAVRDECQLETKIPDFTEEFAKGAFDKIVMADSVSEKTPGKAVKITITDLAGTRGGIYSGPKFVSIKATLWQDGKVIGTLASSRSTSGGAWGGYKGTCSLLGRCAKTLGKDVATWLKEPSMNARAGEAR